MAHHAYVVAGDIEEGIGRALGFAGRELGLVEGEAGIIVRRYGLFSVDDARALMDIARLASPGGGAKAVVVSATRLFHEAQNAMLKLFEEPPKDTYLFLVVPSAGMLLPTMRSRVMVMPQQESRRAGEQEETGREEERKRRGKEAGEQESEERGIAEEYLNAGAAAREKMVAKLLERAKSDKDEEKQRTRADALALAEGLARAAHRQWIEQQESREGREPESRAESELRGFLADLNAFIPILHERSAPLKPIFEHLAIVEPAGLWPDGGPRRSTIG